MRGPDAKPLTLPSIRGARRAQATLLAGSLPPLSLGCKAQDLAVWRCHDGPAGVSLAWNGENGRGCSVIALPVAVVPVQGGGIAHAVFRRRTISVLGSDLVRGVCSAAAAGVVGETALRLVTTSPAVVAHWSVMSAVVYHLPLLVTSTIAVTPHRVATTTNLHAKVHASHVHAYPRGPRDLQAVLVCVSL
jgi:hypothetical protein